MLEGARRIRMALQDPFFDPPPPLLNPDHAFLVLWSAKAACSITFVWYLTTIGLLDDFLASGLSPHAYRGRHYFRSDAFSRGRARVLDDYRIVHVIRDPGLRAVSCYRHVLAHGLADRHFRAFFGRGADPGCSFSFSRYLDFLETIDVANTNLHHRQQLHRIERIRPADRVINISRGMLFRELNHFEEEIGMSRTDFADLGWILNREEDRRAKTARSTDDNVADRSFNSAAAKGQSPWPDYEQFLTPPIRRRIEQIYRADFEAFAPYL